MDKFFTDLEREVLAFVEKPGRYIGNELNIIKKNWDTTSVHIALAFPDVYELGMSYLGFSILYHILNREDHILAERVYAPWPDMQERLREKGLPLYTLESFRPLLDFDLVGFTLQYELHFSNILAMLDLGAIPLRSSKRQSPFPLVVGGGPVAFNPEPVAEFFDLFLIGDAEEAFIELARKIELAKMQGWPRQKILLELASLPGVYVPEFYSPQYDSAGIFTGLEGREGASGKIRARIVSELKPAFYPEKPLVPIIETTHDRVSIEIARGCSQGCRFCNAGIIYRPVRERSVDAVVEQALRNVQATGHEEISLVSLSTCDYQDLARLLQHLHTAFGTEQVNILFPSMRPEKFTPEIAEYASVIRRSGLTLAPEAGTDNLRWVINKNNTSEDLIRATDLAYRKGWNLIKLYFMIGLPSETDADLDGIVELIQEILAVGRRYGTNKKLNISVSPFIPKPHTPFQWERQVSVTEMQRKFDYLRAGLRSRRLKIFMHSPFESKVEAVFSRGDRRLADIIETAWRNGAKFDAWTEYFSFRIWERAFAEHGLRIADYDRNRPLEERLPWDHIEKGVTQKFLLDEQARSLSQVMTLDCRDGKCHHCGLMVQEVCQELHRFEIATQAQKKENVIMIDENQKQDSDPTGGFIKSTPEPLITMRMLYRRGRELRFISHLDIMRLFQRAFRRANILLAFSKGFNPRPKVSYGPPLATGYLSEAEYLDFSYFRRNDLDVQQALTDALPAGIEIIRLLPVTGRARSLSASINRIDYNVQFDSNFDEKQLSENCQRFLTENTVTIERVTKQGSQTINIRPFIAFLEPKEQGSGICLQSVIRNGRTARVEEVIRLVTNDRIIARKALITRVGQYIQFGEQTLTPMDF